MFVCVECGAMQPAAGFCAVDGNQVAPIGEDLLLGTTIGAYRVARLLGIGGMGRVYKGVHPTIGSRVAIKVLSRECSDRRDLVERFFAEAKAVNVIRHESIVNVLDLAMLPDGRPYIIMEYLDGAPLANLIDAAIHQQRPLPLGGVARLTAEVLDALGAAHAKGIVHRDLKPDNIYVTPSGRPKVLDFGIAKLTDTTTTGSSTRTGSLLGTPHYMSPEQAAGRAVDHRADIYAIGIILFECFTGRKPFLAEALFDLLRMHVEAAPPLPRQLRSDLPPELEQVILIALAKQPDQRFANAQAMSMALQHATSQLPPDQWAPLMVTAGPTTNPGGAWAPTPPASWAGRATNPGAGPGHVSTVSAGQVTSHPVAAARRSSRKGVWIAVIAVLLVGGGVTAAVLAQGGGTPDTAAAVVAADTPHEDAPAEIEPAETRPAESKPAEIKPAETKPADSKPVETKPVETKPRSVDLDEVKKDLDEMKKDLEGLEGLGESVGTNVQNQLGGRTGGSSGWFTRHQVQPPSWNPKKIDVDKFVDWAIAEAKRNVPDARLTRIDADGVYASGIADIVQVNGHIDLRFVSPSRTTRPKNVPRGVKVTGRECEFRIMGSSDGAEIYDMSDFNECKSVAIARPRCSMKQVWAKVRAKHKDIDDAVAQITYMTNIVTHKIVWSFSIDDEPDVSEMFADDC